jgi:hypothetical protein
LSDIFREVEEDVRRERLQKIWKAYGDYIIAAGVLMFAAIAGFQLWERHQDNERARAANALTAAQQMTDPAKAAEAFDSLSKDAPGGYALVARLAAANAMVSSGKGKEGIDLYRKIADEDSGTVGMVARLRAGWALSESGTRKELADLLAPLDKDGSAWRPLAREILAFADYRALDMKSAQAKYQALARDTEAPEGLRRRAEAMAAFIRSGGAANFGTVPPPAPAAPADGGNAAAPVPPAAAPK